MRGSGGGLGAWGSLVLLGLCVWTGARAAAPNPVRNLRVEKLTTSSISLRWEVPEGPDPQNHTYWVQRTGGSGETKNQSTADTTFSAEGLEPASSYEFSVWVEQGGVSSEARTLRASTVPNPVRNLVMENRTNSSIGLRWEVPDGPNARDYTYWVQWTGGSGETGNQSTTNTQATVEGLEPGTLYALSVWAEKNGVSGSRQNLSVSTVPNPVRNLVMENRTNSSIGLRWEVPDGPNAQDYTYWVQWTGGSGETGNQSTTNTQATVEGLEPGTLYALSVWAEKNGVSGSRQNLSVSTVPNPVRNLVMENRTNSSISLRWEVPDGPNAQDYTYWVQWTGGSGDTGNQSTTNTQATVEGLEPGTLYALSVWAEKNGVSGSRQNLSVSTVPNPVRNLVMENRTNSSIGLRWEVPNGPNAQDYTYWVQWTGGSGDTGNQSTTNTQATVEGLEPGTLYALSVWAEKNGVSGSRQNLSVSTVPNPVRNLRVEKQTSSSISLRWEVPDGPDPQNHTYWVQWTGDGGKNETRSTTDTTFTADGLKSATLYQFSVWTEKNRVTGPTETQEGSTAPNPVRNLSLRKRTTSSISLSWGAPDGPALPDTYWVEWTDGSGGTKNQSTVNLSITVEGLGPGTLYTFSVWAEKNGVSGSRQNVSGSTVPNAVTSLRIQGQTTSSITLSWAAPLGPAHPPYTYGVTWILEGGGANRSQTTPDTKFTLNAAEAGSLYTFSVWAERHGVSSNPETLNGATAPNEVTALQNKTQTNNSITLQWEAPADPRSHLYVYLIQWARGEHPQRERGPQGRQAYQTGRTKETWYVVEALEPGTAYNFSVWAERSDVAGSTQSLRAPTSPDPVTIASCISTSGGYGVILTWPCPRGGYEAFEWQVGGQRGSQDRASCGRDVSVGGLQPAQSYSASVSTVWAGLRAPSASVTCHTESAGVIAGAIVGVLLLLALVGLLLFFLKRRSKKSQRKSVFSLPRDIPEAEFADHVRRKEKDSNCGFAEEFQHLLLEGQGQSQTVASAPENSAKNRYRNVLPYDWSRVPLGSLGGEPGSDYINASFMPGLWGPREFIAAQGPLPQTVGDFWRLVWEQQSHTLVMLTNCVELGRVKCEHYWPLDAQPCTFGHLQVTLEGEKVKENWTVRDLKLRHKQERKALALRQFHFVAWPDHGVPDSPDPLLAFWKMLRQWLDQAPGGGPPIVHCSAGVGRTGTFIALDVLLRQLECEGTVGPFSFVRKMRESRPLMVQTEAQYVFLHQCILRFLQQSSPAPAQSGAIYENLLFENDEAATQAR